MKNKKVKIFVLVIIVLIVAVILFVSLRKTDSGKYNSFATCLKDKGANFYGAFWCPHCKAQKAEFGSAVKLLPYTECSTSDGNGQTQVCTDKGVESYPTWTFPNVIKITEKTAPVVCTKDPGIAGEDPICERARSKYAKVWLFPDYQISSVDEPKHVGNDWTFTVNSEIRGEMSLEKLAQQTSCVLPVN